jgi:hypothetical protein
VRRINVTGRFVVLNFWAADIWLQSHCVLSFQRAIGQTAVPSFCWRPVGKEHRGGNCEQSIAAFSRPAHKMVGVGFLIGSPELE